MLIEAARRGLELAFIARFLIEDLLQKGELVNLLEAKYKTKFSYRILYPQNNRNFYKVRSFRNWLFEEMNLSKI